MITGNTVAVNFGSTGTPLAAPTTGMQLAAKGLTPTSGELARYAAVNTKYGPVPFKVAQGFTLGKLATSVAAVATNPVLAVGLAVAAPFIADWLADAGSVPDPVTGVYGATVQPILCSVQIGNGTWSATFSTCIDAARSMQSKYVYQPAVARCTTPTGPCYMDTRNSWGDPVTYGLGVSWSNNGSPTFAPATPAQVESKLAATPRTASEVEKIISESAKLQALPTTGNPTPTIAPPDGQPSIKSPTKTDTSTKTNPDGTKVEEVKSCWIAGTVNTGASMTMREVCNTDTTTKAADGTVTGTSTTATTSEGDPTQIQEEGGFCDSLVGKLLCAELDTPEEPVPERSVSVSYNPLNLFGAGSCPAPRTYTSLQTGQTHTASFQPICDALALLRPMFLAIAAFIAYMILLPKGAD